MNPIIMPTPNFGYKNKFGALGGRGVKTRHGHKVKAIVLHVWEGNWTAGTRSWFFKEGTPVSYNDVVLKNGDWIQLVDPFDPAWANGGANKPTWNKSERMSNGRIINPNLYTHSISREGFFREITAAQEKTIAYVAKFRAEQHGLKINRSAFIGHRDLNQVTRSNCPGSGLNWGKFYADVLSTIIGKPTQHIVVAGDIFWKIAQDYKVTVPALAGANPHIKDPARIFPGDVLTIPLKTKDFNSNIPKEEEPSSTKEHLVIKGDIFWKIAQKYKVTVPKLIGANPHIKDPARIFPGDKLIIPKK